MSREHIESHFAGSEIIRDIVIGMSDGLTVPFALAAGLSGAVEGTRIVVVAGLAEIAAGSIAMGLGGYLAARGDAEHYQNELDREWREIEELPEEEAREVRELLEGYGLSAEESGPVVEAMRRRPKDWVEFMMRFELGLERPEPARARTSALTIALSYVAGGIIPLIPYMVAATPRMGFAFSVVVTLLALGVFGYVKSRFTGARAGRGALLSVAFGGAAAAAAYVLARLIS